MTLTGVADNQRVTVPLTGVNGDAAVFSPSLGFLVGDLNNTHAVNASDISDAKTRGSQPTTASNFRFNVNTSGTIDVADIFAAKQRSGLVLP